MAHIPAAVRFRAPRRPAGWWVVGYDERGHCPMYRDGACSVYEHRPRTCRTYDCRVFAAAEVAPAADQPAVALQVRRWRFRHAGPASEARHDAVRQAARYLAGHPEALPDGTSLHPTQLAVLAVEIHHVFVGVGGEPDADRVRAAVAGLGR